MTDRLMAHESWLRQAARWTDEYIVRRLGVAHDWTTRVNVPSDEYHYLYQEAGNRHLPIPTTIRK